MRDAQINVLGMVDEDGPLVEDSRSEDEIYDLAGDAPSLRDREVPRCPTSTYGLPGAIVDDKERFIGLLRWLHQAGNGDYAAAIDGLMNQTATAAEDDVPDRGASEPKPRAISMRIDLADQPLFHKTDTMLDPYPMSDTEEPDQ